MHGLPSFFPPTVGAGPDELADEPGNATADANAAAAADSERDVRMPVPLSDAHLQALLHNREAFLAGDAGQCLRSDMKADVEVLISFAQGHCAPDVVAALQSFHAKLGSITFFDRFWAELLITGRLHLAAIAHAMADAEIPERQRAEALVEVARATGRCGVGIDQELERSRQALTLHAKGLHNACTRMREQQRNAWIEEVCRSEPPPDPLLLGLGPHLARVIKRRLSNSPTLPDSALAGHEALLDHLTAQCRSVITREVSPDAIARALADECLAQVRDSLRERLRVAPDFSGEHPEHMKALEQIVNTLSERYGRLRAASFLELDDEAIPVLACDAALLALDIRDQMTRCRLAPEADDRTIIATGEGVDRLELRVHGERLWYIVAGDPALRELHPVRAEHLRRVAAVPETLSGLSAQAPLGLATADLEALVDVLLAAHACHMPAQLSIEWLANPALARRFGDGLSTAGFSDFLSGLNVAPEDDAKLEALVQILSTRPEPMPQLRQLDFLRPQLLDALLPKIGQARWHAALHNSQPKSAAVWLELLRLAVERLPEAARTSALAMPRNIVSWLLDAGNDDSLRRYFDVLGECGERGLLPRECCPTLFNPMGALATALPHFFQHPALMRALLKAIARLHRGGALRADDVVSFFNFSSGVSTRVPQVLRALSRNSNGSVDVYMQWLLDRGGHDLPLRALQELLYPPLFHPIWTQPIQAAIWSTRTDSLVAYVDGIRSARQLELLDNSVFWLAEARIN